MANKKACDITDEEKCKYASQAAKEAVQETFAILGVDINNPKEVEEFRKSLRFGDDLRKAADKGKITLVIAATGMASAAVWASFVSKVKTGAP